MVRETGHQLYAFRLLLFLGIALITSSRAQVNTEAMRKDDLTPGLHLDIGGDIGYIEGNSSLFQNRSHLRLDYVQEWGQLFLVANYHLGMKDQLLFINKGFSHLRAVRQLRSPIYGEVFLQQEFNEFIQLNDRILVGSGLRIKWNELEGFGKSSQELSLVTGVGLMWEREKIDAGPEGTAGDPVHDELASLLRSTNYAVFDWAPTSTIGFMITTYFQFDTQRLSDYRILASSTLKVSLSKRLSLTLDLNIRYDSEPPGEIEPLDLELRNGFSYTFR
jgi:hypothetical protein